jgi:hypothetical protein
VHTVLKIKWEQKNTVLPTLEVPLANVEDAAHAEVCLVYKNIILTF